MRRWLRPRSRSFHAALGMALLAWTALVAGAFAAPLPVTHAMGMGQTTTMRASHAAVMHCRGMPMQPAAMQHASPQPFGQPACCHNGCDCLMACDVVLGVPRLTLVVLVSAASVPVMGYLQPAWMPAAPPLRPPIA